MVESEVLCRRKGDRDRQGWGQQPGGLLQLLAQDGAGDPPSPHRQLLQPLDGAHGLYILLDPGRVALQPVRGLPVGGVLPQELDAALQDGDGVAQVMGKGGVEPPALLGLLPQGPVGPQQLGPHGLEGPADLPQFVGGEGGEGEVQVLGPDAPGPLQQQLDGLPQLPAVKERPGQSQPRRRKQDAARQRHNPQRLQQPPLLRRRLRQQRDDAAAPDHHPAGRVLGSNCQTSRPQQARQRRRRQQPAEGQQEKGLAQAHVFQPFHL